MPPDIAIGTVRAYHHGHGVPAYQTFNASFDFATARKEGLFVGRNCIDIRGIGRKRQVHPGFLGVHLEVLQQASNVFRSPVLQHIVERIEPFLYFYSVQFGHDVVLIYPITHLGAFPCTERSCSWLRIECHCSSRSYPASTQCILMPYPSPAVHCQSTRKPASCSSALASPFLAVVIGV